jgi:23S rRNA (pseudouridine1915-N3)-methyltransferase
MKLAFLFVGGQKEEWLTELLADYHRKIGFFCPTEIIRVKPSRLSRASSAQKLAEETTDLLKLIKKDDLVIVCDERGEQPSSRKFSTKLIQFFERGRPRVVIVVGGAFGLGEEVRRRADWTWSLSSLVMNHHIAQAVVLEQTYRAFTIWKNIPYHNE